MGLATGTAAAVLLVAALGGCAAATDIPTPPASSAPTSPASPADTPTSPGPSTRSVQVDAPAGSDGLTVRQLTRDGAVEKLRVEDFPR